jgi:hypothetical protein
MRCRLAGSQGAIGKGSWTMNFPQSGGCQCGAVRYEVTGPPVSVYACHCTECQKQSGSAFAMAAVIPQEHFRITQGTPHMFARKASMTKTLECWFCPACGTRLYHLPGGVDYPNRNVKPGTLDDTSWLAPTIHFWTRSKQDWVVIPDDVTSYETQPTTLSWVAPLSASRRDGT